MDSIIQTVNSKGFCCSTTFKDNVEGLERITLPLYVDVKYEGKVLNCPFRPKYHRDPKRGVYIVTGIVDGMNDWASLLNFKHGELTVKRNDVIGLQWDYYYYDILYTIAKININVYYKKITIEKNKNYCIINEDGNVVNLEWDEDGFSQISYVPNFIYSDKDLQEQKNIIVVAC